MSDPKQFIDEYLAHPAPVEDEIANMAARILLNVGALNFGDAATGGFALAASDLARLNEPYRSEAELASMLDRMKIDTHVKRLLKLLAPHGLDVQCVSHDGHIIQAVIRRMWLSSAQASNHSLSTILTHSSLFSKITGV